MEVLPDSRVARALVVVALCVLGVGVGLYAGPVTERLRWELRHHELELEWRSIPDPTSMTSEGLALAQEGLHEWFQAKSMDAPGDAYLQAICARVTVMSAKLGLGPPPPWFGE